MIIDNADVSSNARIGPGSIVWHLAQVREGAVIGEGCVIGRGAYIGSGVYHPVPSHLLVSMAAYRPDPDLPVTERAAAEVISLPVHPSLDEKDRERVVTAVNTVVKAGA